MTEIQLEGLKELVGWGMLIFPLLVLFACLFDWSVEKVIGVAFIMFLGSCWLIIGFSLIL